MSREADPKELLSKGLAILDNELKRFFTKSKKGLLTGVESRSLNDSIRTLLMAEKSINHSKNEEESELAKLTDEEVKEAALLYLNKGKGKS